MGQVPYVGYPPQQFMPSTLGYHSYGGKCQAEVSASQRLIYSYCLVPVPSPFYPPLPPNQQSTMFTQGMASLGAPLGFSSGQKSLGASLQQPQQPVPPPLVPVPHSTAHIHTVNHRRKDFSGSRGDSSGSDSDGPGDLSDKNTESDDTLGKKFDSSQIIMEFI